MKKLVAILMLALVSSTAMAQHHGYYRHGGGYYRGGWVAPALIGGVIGYGLSRPYYADPVYVPPPVVYAPPPVVYSQPAPMVQSNCTRYIIQNEQGQVLREETRCN
jgi:hypothetical protein